MILLQLVLVRVYFYFACKILEQPDFGFGPEVRKSGKVRKSENRKVRIRVRLDSEIGKSEKPK